MREYPRIALSGVRSSCESVARNSSFSWFAACSCSYARALSTASAARDAAASPIGEIGDRQARQRRQDLFGFERGREGRAQARQEYGLLAVALLCRLRALALGNVTRDLRCSDNRRAVVPDRRNAQRDVNERAV